MSLEQYAEAARKIIERHARLANVLVKPREEGLGLLGYIREDDPLIGGFEYNGRYYSYGQPGHYRWLMLKQPEEGRDFFEVHCWSWRRRGSLRISGTLEYCLNAIVVDEDGRFFTPWVCD
ncbi:MAG TPA: hypothetical protein VGN26_16595 [Armatimonadota bacterium]